MPGPSLTRYDTPGRTEAMVLVLHGGKARSSAPVNGRSLTWRRAQGLARTLGASLHADGIALWVLRYRTVGWNGDGTDKVEDARWALDRIRLVLPGLPVVLVGHSMGGRVALQLSGEPDVVGIAALAPWIDSDTRQPPPRVAVLLAHGSSDRVTDPRRTDVLAKRYTDRGVDLRYVEVEGGTHSMLRAASRWHDLVADFVTDVLIGPDRSS